MGPCYEDDSQSYNNLHRSAHKLVGKAPEDDSDSFPLVDVDLPVVAPVTDGEIK